MKRRTLIFLAMLFVVGWLSFAFAQNLPKSGNDENWIRVQSKNFLLIGNADEVAMRQKALKLEQFREAFLRIFPDKKFQTTLPIKVIVFDSEGSFRPFKPLRADGRLDEAVAGYFQTGSDFNYILLNAGEFKDNSDTALHEYVHHLLELEFGTAKIPIWLNEGLATYYQTFRLEKERFAILGEPPQEYVSLFQKQRTVPLNELISLDKNKFHSHEQASRSMLYAQSWALVHFLLHSENNQNSLRFNKYIEALQLEPNAEKAFQAAFAVSPAMLETAFQGYVKRKNFASKTIDLQEKIASLTNLEVSPISEAEAKAHLGELLFQSKRDDFAEKILTEALRSEPNLSLANSNLGLLKMRLGDFAEAEKYLQKSVSAGKPDFLEFYRYAYFLSRENADENGHLFGYLPEKADKMRELLRQSIKLNPNFPAAFELSAFVNLLQNENPDESVELLKRAILLAPNNNSYRFYLATVYLRKEDFVTARLITRKLLAETSAGEFRGKLENLQRNIERAEKQFDEEEQIAFRKSKDPILRTTDETEIRILLREESMRVLRQSLRRPVADEEQVFGLLERVECTRKGIIVFLKNENREFKFLNASLKDIEMVFFSNTKKPPVIGCGKPAADVYSVVTFRPSKEPKTEFSGEIILLEIVPPEFKL